MEHNCNIFQAEESQMQLQYTRPGRRERPLEMLEVEGRVRITFLSRRRMTSPGEPREAPGWSGRRMRRRGKRTE